jgi:hypothetical protein
VFLVVVQPSRLRPGKGTGTFFRPAAIFQKRFLTPGSDTFSVLESDSAICVLGYPEDSPLTWVCGSNRDGSHNCTSRWYNVLGADSLGSKLIRGWNDGESGHHL